jgi:hypothetical protein
MARRASEALWFSSTMTSTLVGRAGAARVAAAAAPVRVGDDVAGGGGAAVVPPAVHAASRTDDRTTDGNLGRPPGRRRPCVVVIGPDCAGASGDATAGRTRPSQRMTGAVYSSTVKSIPRTVP